MDRLSQPAITSYQPTIMVQLVTVQLLAICMTLSGWNGVHSSLQEQLFLVRAQAKVLYQLLAAECPAYVQSKRQLIDDPSALDIEKGVVNQLQRKLIECRKAKTNERITTSQETTTITSAIAASNFTPLVKQSSYCRYAVNLTESWRQDHNASLTRWVKACDVGRYLGYFRFQGEAGE